jgi:hypothetical protein
MRVEAGAVVDEYEMVGIGQVVARYSRTTTPDGVSWKCMFTVVASGVGDLALVHRLVAPTLAEARQCVRHAVEFLAGRGPDPDGVRPPADDDRRAPRIPDPRGNQTWSAVSANPTYPIYPDPHRPEPAPLL